MTTVKERLITFKNNLVTAKGGLATAITAKGVTASGNDSFNSLATKISNIQASSGEADYDIFRITGRKLYNKVKEGDITLISTGNENYFTTEIPSYRSAISDNNTGAYNGIIIVPPEKENYINAIPLEFKFSIDVYQNNTNIVNSGNHWSMVNLISTNTNFATFSDLVTTRELSLNLYFRPGGGGVELINEINSSVNGFSGSTGEDPKMYIQNINTANDLIVRIPRRDKAYYYLGSYYYFYGTFAYKKA
jgi:hypothetical protein